ncbi:PPK2 family polyphosphate kinase [Nakamurella endophytica]|uniref:Polyphosphate kinase n=1 Tax=Nakamurella endophytica TaxID=1748367 RepID=A0A917TC77_9ACTN|nr:PPK2 family polyphosphate kinase [Nakamurella endophytica]GGM17012.1 polyphosphate kinase [Nakamurella endophytica]
MGHGKDGKHGGHSGRGAEGDRPDLVETGPDFLLPPGPVDLARLDTVGSAHGPQRKSEAADALADLSGRLASLQERLFAQGLSGDPRRVLLLLQGMDTAGKDGVIKHVVGLVNPAGTHLVSFKKPTAEELSHDFLWRIERQVPGPGIIGVFNRSQYEDVLIVRVHDLVPRSVWSQRYDAINRFEQGLVDRGVVLVKCFLHVSRAVQKERLAARLEDPEKYWKFNPADVDERGYWADYQQAYAEALQRCSPASAPWHVIPSDRKWYRNWAVAGLLTGALEALDPQYPQPDYDVEAERRRVARS